ncbi:tail fiber assembly protein [Salmonella enterica]|uniref:Tail fiber assembly protein n=1 Tax=Salmonella enterica subsp. enterica serovar Durban TaxID=486992 RepID=A0A632TRY9_SALET|nr:tail fiber assembly protein [Salmonella enterica]ECQ1507808.1 tail fiber assembly protein [Salmonella enterica subsp. enterica serovar Durban]ECU7774346.1 tail fiber assembly protein [Salmonella enterica subsp. enterica serovar Lomalinda]ECW9287090.1 tail fiber assembly protein [Salmonella enterica subsp. enterica serovar Enteritidis]EAQ1714226.1 tail fiber assembly protein [Salmonella enterica]
MSDYYYSFKEKGFFWQPDTKSGDYPDDLIPLTDEHYRELMRGQVDGKYIEHRKGGPVLVEHREYTHEELIAQAEAKKAELLAEAESVIAPLARAVKLGIATDEEQKRLEAWELYSVMVNRVDTSAPDWPDIPR